MMLYIIYYLCEIIKRVQALRGFFIYNFPFQCEFDNDDTIQKQPPEVICKKMCS